VADKPTERSASLLDTIKAVGSAFFGVRGRKAHEQDVKKLNPVHVIIVGVVMAALFVATLIVIVKVVLKSVV
jgi:Protein of unknown function (DUF2970)